MGEKIIYCLVSHKQGIQNANWNWFSKNKCLHAGFSCLCNLFSDFSVEIDCPCFSKNVNTQVVLTKREVKVAGYWPGSY